MDITGSFRWPLSKKFVSLAKNKYEWVQNNWYKSLYVVFSESDTFNSFLRQVLASFTLTPQNSLILTYILRNAVYYGQTDRNLGIWATEHFKSISKGESTTGFSTHCIENNHTFSKDKINLLHPSRKGFRLNLLEYLEIRRGLKTGKFITNDQTVFDSSVLVSPLP